MKFIYKRNYNMPEACSKHQAATINELTGCSFGLYTIHDIFSILPNEITMFGKTGYLAIDNYGIHYTSISNNNEINVVLSEQMSTDIFDCFIEVLRRLTNINN